MVKIAVFATELRFAVIVAEVVAATAEVEILNVPDVAPAATVTVAGTVALELLDVRLITDPFGPAAPLSVTVPTEALPPVTDVGVRLILVKAAGLMVSEAVLDVAPRVAVMVAFVMAETPVVLIVKVADVAPAATVTVAGKVALVVLEVKLTILPPVGAAPFRVKVPVDVRPPMRLVGLTVRLDRTAGVIANVVVCVEVPCFA